jgi:hypothetical protein
MFFESFVWTIGVSRAKQKDNQRLIRNERRWLSGMMGAENAWSSALNALCLTKCMSKAPCFGFLLLIRKDRVGGQFNCCSSSPCLPNNLSQ